MSVPGGRGVRSCSPRVRVLALMGFSTEFRDYGFMQVVRCNQKLFT